jgi:signal transduction histidine kinase
MQLNLAETSPKSITKDALLLTKVPRNITILDLTEEEPRLEVDVAKARRVFVNLIQNAIDAMRGGGELTIRSKRSNGKVEVTFTDTGAGMPEEVKENLWKPLQTTKAKGMGLGLAICKRIVEAHRGTISLESTVGKGTAFTVAMPIKPEVKEVNEA